MDCPSGRAPNAVGLPKRELHPGGRADRRRITGAGSLTKEAWTGRQITDTSRPPDSLENSTPDASRRTRAAGARDDRPKGRANRSSVRRGRAARSQQGGADRHGATNAARLSRSNLRHCRDRDAASDRHSS
jgi:hypothetical protein